MRDIYACRLPLAEQGHLAYEQALRLVQTEVVRDLGLSSAVFSDNEGSRAMSRHVSGGVGDTEPGLAGPEAGPPATVVEAVEGARNECARLVLLADCLESAQRATYRRPGCTRRWLP